MIDTHLHLIDRKALDYNWLSSAPDLDRDWSLHEYAAQARKIGITGALHMEVDVADDRIEDETDWVEAQAKAGLFPILGIIAACRPEADGFAAFLERNAQRVVGFRRVLHVVPHEVSQSTTFRTNVQSIGQAGRVFDMCVLARQLPLAIALADAAPNTPMVLDHCGGPDIEAGAWDDWAQSITELAKRENVCAKLSGVVAYGGPNWSLDGLRPWVEHVAAQFGPGRICWGGDWPVCTLGGGLPTWVAASRTITESWSETERSKLYSENAQRIWRI